MIVLKLWEMQLIKGDTDPKTFAMSEPVVEELHEIMLRNYLLRKRIQVSLWSEIPCPNCSYEKRFDFHAASLHCRHQ